MSNKKSLTTGIVRHEPITRFIEPLTKELAELSRKYVSMGTADREHPHFEQSHKDQKEMIVRLDELVRYSVATLKGNPNE